MAQAKKTAPKKTTARTTTKATAAKKAPVKKTPAKKAPVAKAAVRKAPAKRTVAKKTTAKKQAMRSFRVSQDKASFTTFRITRQTVYWIILVAFIIFAQLWILKLQVEVASLLEAQQITLQDQF